ncbi:MAG TPA: restriction endonuclease subunit S [Candidatus Aphodovivens excrementavium]|nr:restriction endonuclease subunit S [Candidatus Aphodovivens excrementavium]
MLVLRTALLVQFSASAWEQRKLGELYVRSGSGGTPKAGNPAYYGGSIPFLGISDMNGRFITHTEKSITEKGLANSAAWIVPAGSVSLAMYASVGKVGITCCDIATSQAFFNMVFDSSITRDFVYARLDKADCEDEWRGLVSTGTQSNLNAKKVRMWQLAVPSLPEQQAIGAFFRDFDDLIALHQRKRICRTVFSVRLESWR